MHEVSKGYNGGCKYLDKSPWDLISKFSQKKKCSDLLTDAELQPLLDFVNEHCIIYNTTIPIESMNKPIKDMSGSQKISENNINRTVWSKFNLNNALFVHPIHYYYKSKDPGYQLPSVNIPGVNNKYCQTFPLPSQLELDRIRKDLNDKPREYIMTYKDPTKAIGLEYNLKGGMKSTAEQNKQRNVKKGKKGKRGKKRRLETTNISTKSAAPKKNKKRKMNQTKSCKYNLRTNFMKRWDSLTIQVKNDLKGNVNRNEILLKSAWNKLINNDMIEVVLIEAILKMVAAQNEALDLGFYRSYKYPNHIRLLNTFGAHIIYCHPIKHYILLQKKSDNTLLIHDSYWKSDNITLYTKQKISTLTAEYGVQTIKLQLVQGQHQSIGSLNCALFCVAKITELVYGHENLNGIYFHTTKLRRHLAHCLYNNKLTPFPKTSKQGSFKNKEIQIKLICICRKPAGSDKNIVHCNECKVDYHTICIQKDLNSWKNNKCHICVGKINTKLFELQNTGNSCFVNCAIQMLLNTDDIYNYYINTEMNEHHTTDVSNAFAEFCQDQNKDIKKLTKSVAHVFKYYLDGHNHDAGEFWNDFIGHLDKRIICKSFHGLENTIHQCQSCSYKKNYIATFNSLTLPIEWLDERNNKFVAKNITQCITKRYESGGLDCTCNKCGASNVSNQLKCIKYPEYLILILNRGSNENKLKHLIRIEPDIIVGEAVYNLYAVVNHSENPDHYTINVKKQNGWYHINDSVIYKLHKQYIITEKVYIVCGKLRH